VPIPSGCQRVPLPLGVDSSWVPECPDRPGHGRTSQSPDSQLLFRARAVGMVRLDCLPEQPADASDRRNCRPMGAPCCASDLTLDPAPLRRDWVPPCGALGAVPMVVPRPFGGSDRQTPSDRGHRSTCELMHAPSVGCPRAVAMARRSLAEEEIQHSAGSRVRLRVSRAVRTPSTSPTGMLTLPTRSSERDPPNFFSSTGLAATSKRRGRTPTSPTSSVSCYRYAA